MPSLFADLVLFKIQLRNFIYINHSSKTMKNVTFKPRTNITNDYTSFICHHYLPLSVFKPLIASNESNKKKTRSRDEWNMKAHIFGGVSSYVSEKSSAPYLQSTHISFTHNYYRIAGCDLQLTSHLEWKVCSIICMLTAVSLLCTVFFVSFSRQSHIPLELAHDYFSFFSPVFFSSCRLKRNELNNINVWWA